MTTAYANGQFRPWAVLTSCPKSEAATPRYFNAVRRPELTTTLPRRRDELTIMLPRQRDELTKMLP